MLLRITLENVLCFKDATSISLVATSDEQQPLHVTAGSTKSQPSILKAVALYGANAHGKTQFVEAIDLLKQFVTGFSNGGSSNEAKVEIPFFELDDSCSKRPSKFVIEFRINGEDYEYGLVIERAYISEEWLFVKPPRSKEQKVFERKTSSIKRGKFETVAEFGPRLTKEKSPTSKHSMLTYLEVISSGLAARQCLVSDDSLREFSALKSVFDWFDTRLTPISADATYSPMLKRAKAEKDFVKKLNSFLQEVDVGICEIELDEVLLESSTLLKELDDVKAQIGQLGPGRFLLIGNQDGSIIALQNKEKGQFVATQLMSCKTNASGKSVKFSMNKESSGTRRLIDLLPMLIDKSSSERVYIVDELDRKLHPLLAKRFVEAFLKHGMGQIIFTTHNTFLMDLKLLRRDEIWFIQKKKDGSSEMYSLADMKVRPDLDVRKGYLNGRFGAVPFLGNLSDLNW